MLLLQPNIIKMFAVSFLCYIHNFPNNLIKKLQTIEARLSGAIKKEPLTTHYQKWLVLGLYDMRKLAMCGISDQ